jgi:hypothetical protein
VNDLTILVNTSDSFQDCWDPFFRLFSVYWPECTFPIVLNTEKKIYHHPRFSILSARVADGASARLSWSECLARCLDGIQTPFILYLQEDYFLEAEVNAPVISALLEELRCGRADVIRLMECGGAGPWQPTSNPLIWRVDQRSDYRISLQAGLWRKSTLRSHLRMHESPWQLEVFGSARARRLKDHVLCVNRDRFHGQGREVFPYQPTGVVKGRWEQQIVEPLFARHGIEIDFTQRGFFDRAAPLGPKRNIFARVTDRLRSLA